jgi:branched-chain amino acid aminotransferase
MVVLNGELMPRSGARIGVDDAGFLLGDGVFETLRAEAGVPLRIDAHLARLGRSLAAVGIALPWRLDELRSQVALVLEVNARRPGSSCVRITVTRGGLRRPGAAASGEIDRPPVRSARRDTTGWTPTVLVTADPYEPPSREAYEHGVDVQVSAHVRHPHPLHGVKSISHAGSSWLRRESSDPRVFEMLQFNDVGFLAEGSFTNVFVVAGDGVLRTPRGDDGCLEGVTREAVLDLARARGSRVELGGIDRKALREAAEIFLTSSLAEVVPVRSVDGMPLPAPCPGPLTSALRAAYLELSRADVTLRRGRRRGRATPAAGLERDRLET